MNATGFALVAGAGSGIGLETALLFAERGARGVAFADKDLTAAQAGAEKSKPLATWEDFRAIAIEVDVTNAESVERMVQRAKEEFGRIDYFVNSAGKARDQDALVTAFTLDEWVGPSLVDCRGVEVCLKELLKVMKAQGETFVEGRSGRRSIGRGSIVNVVSSGLIGVPNTAAHTTAKFAANAATRAAAMRVGPKGIRVNSLCPGFTKSPQLRRELDRDPHLSEIVGKATPTKRVATPEEIAEVAHFLASPAASYVNGHIMVADFGFSISELD